MVRKWCTGAVLAAGISALGMGGCSNAFDKDWQTKTPVSAPDPAVSLSGKWEGTWQSNGDSYYNGLLKFIVTPLEAPSSAQGTVPQRYEVHVKLFYFQLFPKEYTFTLLAAPGNDGKTVLTGEKDFGAMSDGVFKFEGDAQGKSMYLSYVSVKDYGTFTLRRYPPQ